MLANSRLVADDTIAGGGLAEGKVSVIENGLDLPDVCADVGHQPPVGLMVAQMRPEKAHVDLVRALALVADPPSIRLIGDGSQRAAVVALATELGVDGSLVLEGAREHAGDAFAEVQFGLLTSHNEGLPNAVLEAFSYSVPVIATAVGGVPDLVVDGLTGLLVPPRDAARAGPSDRAVGGRSRSGSSSAGRRAPVPRTSPGPAAWRCTRRSTSAAAGASGAHRAGDGNLRLRRG